MDRKLCNNTFAWCFHKAKLVSFVSFYETCLTLAIMFSKENCKSIKNMETY